jgi:Regulator of polyketide synthase expression
MILYKAYIKIKNKHGITLIKDLITHSFLQTTIDWKENVAILEVYDDDAFQLKLNNLLSLYLDDVQDDISILIVPCFDFIFEKYLDKTNNKVSTIFDIFAKNINEEEIVRDCKKIYHQYSKRDVETIRAFLQCNANSCETANQLYLHRNSFTYRMNHFSNKYRMEFRDLNTMLFIKLIISINE